MINHTQSIPIPINNEVWCVWDLKYNGNRETEASDDEMQIQFSQNFILSIVHDIVTKITLQYFVHYANTCRFCSRTY